MNKIRWNQKNKISPKLRTYQIKAIEKSLHYLKSSSTEQCLIKMPTGTGKTVVMGVISLFINCINNVLIIAPSSAIRDQLFRELKKDLWEKINVEIEHETKIEKLFPKNVEHLLDIKNEKIFITTIQALTQLKSNNEEMYNKLKGQIQLVLFDEGHKEPATKWAEIIRGFNKKTILFSATPIRNDSQLFNVDKKYIFNYSLKQALEENIIRTPEFKYIDYEYGYNKEKNISFFLNKVVEFKEKFECENKYNPKVIIRFSSYENLRIAISYLEKREINAIAIHEQFKNTKNDNYRFNDVPSKHDAIYWLAQNKLVEGIDNNQFAILAIYDGFNNARSFIQQIGRTLRKNPQGNYQNKSWIIINRHDSHLEEMWLTFLDYESNISLNEILLSNYRAMFSEYLGRQPGYIYDSKSYLKKMEIKNFQKIDDVINKYKLPLKVNIFSLKNHKQNNFDLNTVIDKIMNQKIFLNEFLINKHVSESNNMQIVIYAKYGNSPILSFESFMEVKLGLLFVHINNENIFYYDTNNYVSDEILKVSNPINRNQLELLFNDNTEFTEITIRNGMLSQNNIHRQIINTTNLNNIAPNITDKYKFCTTVSGRIIESGESIKRYIGFSNSRISENSKNVFLKDYIKWIEKINRQISNKDSQKNIFFQRYANAAEPNNTKPILISFNLNKLEKYLVDSDGNSVKVEELNYKVVNGGIELEINNIKKQLNIKYENKKYKLSFENPKLDKEYRFKLEEDYVEHNIKNNETLIGYLNRTQDFQIVTEDVSFIYYKKEFVNCTIPKEDRRLDGIFAEYELLNDKKITSEKGDLTISSDEWTEGSLFYLISSLGKDLEESSELKQALKAMDYLICTDLNTEVADFIGLDKENKKIYFIHCKAKEADKSATVFQDLTSQIIKNLDYTHPLSDRIPPLFRNWNSKWKYNNVERNRIIKGEIDIPKYTDSKAISKNEINKKAIALWKEFKEIQKDPDSTTYIWALTGKMFSLEKYTKEKNKGENKKQNAEIIQIDYLLMSTWANVQSTGAKFKLFFDRKS